MISKLPLPTNGSSFGIASVADPTVNDRRSATDRSKHDSALSYQDPAKSPASVTAAKASEDLVVMHRHQRMPSLPKLQLSKLLRPPEGVAGSINSAASTSIGGAAVASLSAEDADQALRQLGAQVAHMRERSEVEIL